MLTPTETVRVLENESARCWLLNFHQSTINLKETNSYISALQLYFITKAEETVTTHIVLPPYFFVITTPGMEHDVTLGLTEHFKTKIKEINCVSKDDLSLPNHLSGIKQSALKISFQTQNDLVFVRNKLARAIARNSKSSEQQSKAAFYSEKELDMALSEAIGANGSTHVAKSVPVKKSTDILTFWSKLVELREHDVPYEVRVCIDWQIFAGSWYDVDAYGGKTTLFSLGKDNSLPLIPSSFRYISFDIETTKQPLKFPLPMTDQIFMISIMYETHSVELLINREVVSTDIRNFHYFPRNQQKSADLADGIDSGGCVSVRVQNLSNEANVILAFQKILQKYQPHVVVTYNGDNFDFPFLATRAKVNGISLQEKVEKGDLEVTSLNQDDPENRVNENDGNKFGFGFLSNAQAHIDCLYWVKRDSYLPMGSHSLKAVTKMKLNYNPVEIDPEEMLPLAKRFPQRMASYSVSDVVATGELFQNYIQPFTFSLCTIIPYAPQKVLRRGSGALCEALLMNQASERNILYPNKIEDAGFDDTTDSSSQNNQNQSHNVIFERYKLRFYNGTLIDTETYIGGVVEALESGVFRCDLDVDFNSSSSAYEELISNLDEVLATVIAKEFREGINWSSSQEKIEQIEKLKQKVKNFEDVKNMLKLQLDKLRSTQHLREKPNILHLDVSAMYPNIILTNRLQPTSIVSDKTCASCIFNDPINRCKRKMNWIRKGTMFTATKAEVIRIIGQLEKETFPYSAIRRYLNTEDISNEDLDDIEGPHNQVKNEKGNQSTQATSDFSIRNSYRPDKRIYNDRTYDNRAKSSNTTKPKTSSKSEYLFTELQLDVQKAILKKRITEYCKRGHKKLHTSQEVRKTSVVCMRENSFYVDTVQLFRDRRYEYKAQTRQWKKKLENLEAASLSVDHDIKLNDCQQKVIQYESLQTAHKCILNSFYGYVMRTGARWGSIEMAGIVTHLGGQIIQLAREFAQSIGIPLELDTDGIWCCLPSSFPLNVVLEVDDSEVKRKVAFNYPCAVLNTLVQKKFSNDQYQDIDLSTNMEDSPGSISSIRGLPNEKHIENEQDEALAPARHVVNAPKYATRPAQCCIEFEVDGPHHAMILPASQDEGGSIKKRYAVYYKDYSGCNQGTNSYKLGELKGFELKRRGELKILKDFQESVFDMFMLSDSLKGSYASAALVANRTLNILINHGFLPETANSGETHTFQEIDDEDILEMVTESRTLSKELGEYPSDQKSLALTTAKRLLKLIEMASQEAQGSEWSGTQPVSDYSKNTKGLSCAFVVSKYPLDSPLAERALPTILFSHHVVEVTRKYWLTKWTNISLAALENDHSKSLNENSSSFKYLKMVLDWEYYITRFSACVQKIITIPAALQGMLNPIPLINHPAWLETKLKKQRALKGTYGSRKQALLTFQKEVNSPTMVYESKKEHNLLIPAFPLEFETNLRANMSVAENIQKVQDLPEFRVWLLHMSRTWQRKLHFKNEQYKKPGFLLESPPTNKVVKENHALNAPFSDPIMQIIQISSHEDEIILDTLVNNLHPLKFALPITEKIVFNVTKPLNLDAYSSYIPQGGRCFLSIEPFSLEGLSLPDNHTIHYLYKATSYRDRKEKGWMNRSEIIECLQRNVLPVGVSQGWSTGVANTIQVSKISDGGFICGLYPSHTDAIFDTIVNLGNTFKLKPKSPVDLAFLEVMPHSVKEDSQQNVLEMFSGSAKIIRTLHDDLISVSNRELKTSKTCDVNSYEQTIRSLEALYVYHVVIERSPNCAARLYAVILIDVYGEKGLVYVTHESQENAGSIGTSSLRYEEAGKKRKLRGKTGLPAEKNIQKTIHPSEISIESIKELDDTLIERINELQQSTKNFYNWKLPDSFDKVLFSSSVWTDAVSGVSESVDDYIVKFGLKHRSKTLVIVQSAHMKDSQTNNTSQLSTDAWKNISLPRASASIPILRIPMNTSDEHLSETSCDVASKIQAITARCVHRYFFASSGISYYISFSQYGRIPLCNLHRSNGKPPDSIFWDVAYARQLLAKGYIWVKREKSAYTSALCPISDTLNDFCTMDTSSAHELAPEIYSPQNIAEVQYGAQIDGVHAKENTVISTQFAVTWSVEFSLENIAIAAVFLLSIRNDKSEHPNLPTPADVSDIDLENRLQILRWTVECVYAKETKGCGIDVQLSVLQNLPYLLRGDPSFESVFQDPGMQAMYMHSLRKALAILLLYFKKRIGGRVIFANTTRIIIGTDKKSIDECFDFAKHAVAMCSENSSDSTISLLFRYAKLHITSFWCPILFVNEKNFIGRQIEIDLQTFALNVQKSTIEYQWESSEIFPHLQQRKMYVAHLLYFMMLSSNLVDAALKTTQNNLESFHSHQVFLRFILSGIYKYLQTSFQQQLLKQLDLFTHIGGDVCKYAGLFLRYICIILQTTKTIEDSNIQHAAGVVMTVSEIIESIYQNACRILDSKIITSDSHNALLHPSGSLELYREFSHMLRSDVRIGRIAYILPFTILRDYTCPFCLNRQNLYLLNNVEKEISGKSSDTSMEVESFSENYCDVEQLSILQCLYCTFVFDEMEIENFLIDSISRDVNEYFAQDIICAECGVCKETLLVRQCTACVHGEIQCKDRSDGYTIQRVAHVGYQKNGKHKNQSMSFRKLRENLLSCTIIAKFRHFELLQQIVDSYAGMFLH